MMQCKINNTSTKEKQGRNPEHLESSGIFWDVDLRASQLSHTNRGSRPEILEVAPGKNEKEEVKQSCFFDRRVKPKNLERLNNLEGKNTTEMNEVKSTPVKRRNKEHYENLVG